MDTLADGIDRVAAEINFSGVVRVDRHGEVAFAAAYGRADRAHAVENTVDTKFATASATKGLTAMTVMRLVEQEIFDLATTARALLGPDLAMIRDDVTIEQLLGHRSGIGDYLDEDIDQAIDDYVLTVAAHELATTESYVAVLDGFATKFDPGERFSYCNGGYVVLALLAERATGTPFHELVHEHVCERAGLVGTAFLRSDELPGDAAMGYLSPGGLRTNVMHLPVRGNGDGGIYSTAADIHALWRAFFEGRIVSLDSVAAMTRPRSDVPSEHRRYGLGFWLHDSTDTVMLVGSDAGVSFRSVHHPSGSFTHTVLSNMSHGAWPVTRRIDELLGM
ncbi:MAG: serine hydrolase domain-containing protein [Ilumatobacteraceae bacterium]